MDEEKKSLPAGMLKRGRVYYANFRFEGALIRKRLCSDLAIAKEKLNAIRHDLYRRSVGDISNDFMLDQLSTEWLRSLKQTRKSTTVLRYHQNIAHFHRLLPVRNVADITVDLVEEFREKRLNERVGEKEVQPQTVNKDVAALLSMLNWAIERQKIGSNPIIGIRKLPEYPKESRALEPEEVMRLLSTSSEHWRRIWYGYLTTGARKMELANSLFTDVDWKLQELVIRAGRSKSGRERRIPLDDRLFEIFGDQREKAKNRQPGKWSDRKTTRRIQELFTRQHILVTTANTPLGGNIYREFKAACKRADITTMTTGPGGEVIEVVCLHSTRHTFASNLIVNGADPRSVQTLLGHRTLDMTMKVYAKLFKNQTRTAISKLSIGDGVLFKND